MFTIRQTEHIEYMRFIKINRFAILLFLSKKQKKTQKIHNKNFSLDPSNQNQPNKNTSSDKWKSNHFALLKIFCTTHFNFRRFTFSFFSNLSLNYKIEFRQISKQNFHLDWVVV